MPLDQDVINLAKAIRNTESRGNFQAEGKSGEYGAYQYTEPTWQKYATEAGVTSSLRDATPEDQNKVTYTKLKQWKDQGYNPGQIASMWNAGEGEPDAYTGKFSNGQPSVGKNKYGVEFNVPQYAESVASYYHDLKNGVISPSVKPNPSSALPDTQMGQMQQPKENLGDQLASRLHDISNVLSQQQMGQISTPSAILQGVGAVAGGVGDVVNAGLRLVPGVGFLEDKLSDALGSLAKTSTGQSIIAGVQEFSQEHPEMAGDIGAAINIASVFPLFKGISLLQGAAKSTVATALESRLAGAATNELTEFTGRTIAGRTMLEDAKRRGLDPIRTIIGRPGARYIPDVSITEDGRAIYSSGNAWSQLKDSLAGDEEHLDRMLKAAHDDMGISLDVVKRETISMAKQELAGHPDFSKVVAKIESDFEGIKKSLGDRTWTDTKGLNDIKRQVRSSVNFKSDKLDEDARYLIGQAMMKKVEETAAKNGVKGVRELNKVMASKINAMKVLKSINGKALRSTKRGGLVREIGADLATGGGEAAGNMLGVPFAGALIGRSGAKMLLKKAPGTSLQMLNRAGNPGGLLRNIKGGLLRTASPGVTQSQLPK